MTAAIEFTSRIEITGINPYVRVLSEVATALQSGWRRPMPVLVWIVGGSAAPWRTNIMPTGDGDFLLYLHGRMRRDSRTAVGDEVVIGLSFDAQYRGGPTQDAPEWFRTALDDDATARSNWNELTPSRQKEVVRYLANLRSDAARARNLDRVMRMLGGESGHYMGRDWSNGR